MRTLPAAAVVLVVFALVPGVALASHGQVHGPSTTPLLMELGLAALVAITVLARRPVAHLVQAVAHSIADAGRSLAHHRVRRVS